MKRKLFTIGFLAIVAVLIVSVSSVLGASYCSIRYDNPFPITFVNNSGVTVDIYWVDYSCNEQFRVNDLANGASVPHNTFESHPFVVRNAATGEFIYCFVASVTGNVNIPVGPLDLCQIPEPDSKTGAVPGVPCLAAYDGRINNVPELDCAPPTAIYDEGDYFALYGIDPATGAGDLVFRIQKADIGDTPAENTLLAEGSNVFTGQPVSVWHLSSGELQVNATYADGKPYIFLFDNDGSLISHAAA